MKRYQRKSARPGGQTPVLSILAVTLGVLVSASWAHAEDPREAGLISKDFVLNGYQGSFKIDYSDGVSSTAYANGRVAYNAERNSVLIDSHVYQLSIGEFRIPDNLSTSTNKDQLPNAQNLQGFRELFGRTDTGEQDGMDHIGGMAVLDGQLYVQAYDTYDANGDARQTTLVVRDPGDMSGSAVDGFYEMDGAARTVNYLSPLPYEWRSLLGGEYLAGNGGGMSISSRLSEGPSLYTFDPNDLTGNDWFVPTEEWMNYPVEEALSSSLWQDHSVSGYGDWDVENDSGNNDMWTVASTASFGFIIPGTRTFMVIGGSGMHESGGGYKITNDAGFECGGHCAHDNEDYHTYYWLFDMNDVLDATNPWDVLPYEYGIFDDRFMEYNEQGGTGEVTGGSFDLQSGTLVLSHAAATKNHESGSPIISVYKLPVPVVPKPPSNVTVTTD